MEEFIEEGIVLSTGSNNTAIVKITPKGTCPDNHEGCPVRALAKGRGFTVDARNPLGASAGQRVMVEMKTPHYYKGLFLVFGMPLVMLIIGYITGILLSKLFLIKEETFGFIGMGLGFGVSFFLMGSLGNRFNVQYTVVKTVENRY